MKPLHARVSEIEDECRRHVHERAVELSANGVPVIVIEKMLLQAGGNVFAACIRIAEDRKRDAEIAEKHGPK